MDHCPDLKVCLAKGGGYACFGIGRINRGWRVRSEARDNIQQTPSAYLRKFYYDCLTHSEPALRMLIDAVGVEAERHAAAGLAPAERANDRTRLSSVLLGKHSTISRQRRMELGSWLCRPGHGGVTGPKMPVESSAPGA